MCLHLNRKALGQAGYAAAFAGRDGIPSGKLNLRLPSPRHGDGPHPMFVKKTTEHLATFAVDGQPLILSEENILGRMYHLFAGQFYPAAEARFRALKASLNGPVCRVVLVVRPYAGLYTSAFRKRAEDTRVRPFGEFVPKLMAMDRGWPEIVEALRDILKPEALVIVPFAQRGTSAQLLQRLVPEAGGDWAEPDKIVNLSPTDAALEALQALHHADEKVRGSQRRAIIQEHADDTGRGFAAFPKQEKAELDALYEADLARIRQMDGVCVVGGAEDKASSQRALPL